MRRWQLDCKHSNFFTCTVTCGCSEENPKQIVVTVSFLMERLLQFLIIDAIGQGLTMYKILKYQALIFGRKIGEIPLVFPEVS